MFKNFRNFVKKTYLNFTTNSVEFRENIGNSIKIASIVRYPSPPPLILPLFATTTGFKFIPIQFSDSRVLGPSITTTTTTTVLTGI